jgi:hypothetical protein
VSSNGTNPRRLESLYATPLDFADPRPYENIEICRTQ